MPTFKIEIQKTMGLRSYDEFQQRNPFLIRDIFSKDLKSTVHVRCFEFEADSECHALRLYEEAKTADLENVRGYSLRSIEQI